MAAYSAASRSWRNANPTVRNSAKISKPSKVQPRFEAISTFHCARLSERYQGSDNTASLLDMIGLLPCSPSPRSLPQAVASVAPQYRDRRRQTTTDANAL